MGSNGCNEEKKQHKIVYNVINNGTINYNEQNNYQFQNYQQNNFQSQTYLQINKPSNCCCPLCGEEFLKGKFINSGESKDHFFCWKCEQYQNNKYYFKCKNSGSKFCTDCP